MTRCERSFAVIQCLANLPGKKLRMDPLAVIRLIFPLKLTWNWVELSCVIMRCSGIAYVGLLNCREFELCLETSVCCGTKCNYVWYILKKLKFSRSLKYVSLRVWLIVFWSNSDGNKIVWSWSCHLILAVFWSKLYYNIGTNIAKTKTNL